MSEAVGVLEVDDLLKHFPAPGGELVKAVDGVSFKIAPGELVALYGPSGSGKTTLLKLIAAVLPPDSGDIRVAGRSIVGMRAREASQYLRRDVGVVLQTFHMIAGLTTIENASVKLLASGVSRREAEHSVVPLLERLGLGARVDHRASDLSMGERQRLALARALSTGPPLLLADEPTASLDTRRGQQVLQLLREVSREQGTVVLLATHDPRAAAIADQVHTLEDGVLASGRRDAGADAASVG